MSEEDYSGVAVAFRNPVMQKETETADEEKDEEVVVSGQAEYHLHLLEMTLHPATETKWEEKKVVRNTAGAEFAPF